MGSTQSRKSIQRSDAIMQGVLAHDLALKGQCETVLRQWRGPKGQGNDFRKFANSDDCGRLGRDIHGLGTRRRGR
jgi:hypothetical protein